MIWDESLKLQDDRFLSQGIVIDLELTNVLNRLWKSVGIIFVNLENYWNKSWRAESHLHER